MSSSGWHFWIDRGGTFTDIVARSPDGRILSRKFLSENPDQYRDAATYGIRSFLGIGADDVISPHSVADVRMGTTVGTNALLEHKGEPTLLVTNTGLADQLRIGYQARPRIFDRNIRLPDMLYTHILEVTARMSAAGDEIRPLDEAAVTMGLQHFYDQGLRACAIVLMHGYRYPAHEQVLGRIAKAVGFTQISLSHEASPLIKYVRRGDTAVVDAYLSPVLRRYVDQVAGDMPHVPLKFMQSHGGLTDAQHFQGRDSIVSGPAGGMVGAVETAKQAGFHKILTFDMGGTSTDVAHYAGAYERTADSDIAGVRLQTPMLRIHTVAAGGGSICHFDGARFRVGPDSAGANPGPACYRCGGPLTITDCNVLLGRIRPQDFPAVFGPQGNAPLDAAIVKTKFEALAKQVFDATGQVMTPQAIAAGFIHIAVTNMAHAIRKVSIQRGYDISHDYAINVFGGAGGQHACQVADALGVQTLFIHPLAGVLSAFGMGLADNRVIEEKSFEINWKNIKTDTLDEDYKALKQKTLRALKLQGFLESDIVFHVTCTLKYDGTDSAVRVAYAPDMLDEFAAAYKRRYGFTMADKPLILEAIQVEGVAGGDATALAGASLSPQAQQAGQPIANTHVYVDGSARTVPVFAWHDLAAEQVVTGPALILDPHATTWVDVGWQATMQAGGWLVVRRQGGVQQGGVRALSTTTPDPVMLEVFNNLFMAIAEQMGYVLEQTAYSVNIKERLDFSCALFDASGQLIANAPHMPVHLGSMGESVRHIINTRAGTMQVGDSYMLNDPYHGGTHLPDITVVAPVFDETGTDILFYVASRGHHADVGGLTPGSMPPHSRTIDDEGVLIDDVQIVKAGIFCEDVVTAVMGAGPYPARNITQNIGDLKAQCAANAKGVDDIQAMVRAYGADVVAAYVRFVQDHAEASVRRAIARLKDGHFEYPLDNGAKIEVALKVDVANGSAIVDFSGTSAQLADNFNAPSAVCRAAVLYVFRTLVVEDIPMNEGCMRPITLIIPAGSMLNPAPPAAVVAGNVETSQCVTDALYGAMGVLAAAQGTMNNFTFGNDTYQYYETLCGGAGAGPDFDGQSAIHTHMTNSRLTDPEVLEWRYPVLLEEFSIRRGSGGMGRQTGGCGTRRRLRFLVPMTAALLANHRTVAPFGLSGGQAGDVGRAWVERESGVRENLGATARTLMQTGDIFAIETPGGGGFGPVL